MNVSFMLSAISSIPYEVKEVLNPLLLILMAIVSVATIVVVLMQSSVESNMGAITGDRPSTNMEEQRAKSRESKLKKATVSMGAFLLVISIIYFVIQLF